MRYFLDTEFIEDGNTIDLISIGIVAEDGREFYREVVIDQIPWDRADPWVLENVKPHLLASPTVIRPKSIIAQELLDFIDHDKPEFWAYYADYDWVVLCQLYGRMIDLPKGWPMFCMDLKQLAVMMGNPMLPKQQDTEHHALSDARWNRDTFWYLMKLELDQ